METKLAVLAAMARQKPKYRFTNLAYLLNEGLLTQCFLELRKDAASGIDGETWEGYAENLQENIADLVQRLKAKRYWPQPVRRVYIPKDNRTKRPLGIPALEDRIVQAGMRKILEAIFEGDFLPVSYGFRPGKGCGDVLQALEQSINTQKVNYVVDADIKAFFDSVDHKKLIACLQKRISDPGFLSLVVRMLKAGVMEDGEYQETDEGTPQGGLISPILSNIFLHYALDRWFEQQAKQKLRGYAALYRYADDFVVCVQYEEDAKRILKEIGERFADCGLSLSQEKTRLVEFGRFAAERAARRGEQPGTFVFLGFLHYCDKSRRGKFRVGRTTSPKKFRAKVKALGEWLKATRNRMPLRELWGHLRRKLQGHYNYYGVSGNSRGIERFYDSVVRLAYKWLNRRSQKKSFNWEQFRRYLKRYPLPKPRIRHQWWCAPSLGL